MLRLMPVITLTFLMSACAQSAPSEDEISKVLSERVVGKGCATSTLFKTFPIPQSTASTNSNIIKPFVNIGFISESDGGFQLTKKGQASYDAERSGFCYTNSYQVSDVKIIGAEAASDLPPALSGAWYVSVKVAPNNVDEWIKNPAIINAASLASLEKIVQPQSFKVRVAKEKGKDELIVADPAFSFKPGIHFNMGW
nr:acyltransferase [Pseudomonas viridiflava]